MNYFTLTIPIMKKYFAMGRLLLKKHDLIVRIILGLWLLRHFVLIYEVRDALLYMNFMSPLFSKIQIFAEHFEEVLKIGTWCGLIFSVFFIFGFLTRISALGLILNLILVINLNIRLWQFHYAFIVCILFAYALFDSSNYFSLKFNFMTQVFRDTKWKNRLAFVFATSILSAGISKLFSNYWIEGTALASLCKAERLRFLDLRLDCETNLWLLLPLKYLTWFSLSLELICFILILFKPTRFLFFVSILIFQFGIYLVMHIPYLNSAMAIVACALFQDVWFRDFAQAIIAVKRSLRLCGINREGSKWLVRHQ